MQDHQSHNAAFHSLDDFMLSILLCLFIPSTRLAIGLDGVGHRRCSSN
jgi:hypothetical protein